MEVRISESLLYHQKVLLLRTIFHDPYNAILTLGHKVRIGSVQLYHFNFQILKRLCLTGIEVS